FRGRGWALGSLAVLLMFAMLAAPSPALSQSSQSLPSIAIGDAQVVEGDHGTVDTGFVVRLSVPSTSPVSVVYATVDGTATAGSDYRATSGTLTFKAGATTQSIVVRVTGDS